MGGASQLGSSLPSCNNLGLRRFASAPDQRTGSLPRAQQRAGGEGRPIARVEHVLAVKPVMPIPGPIANYTKGIFTRQVANILRDLEREISVRAAAEAAAGGG
ncbi:hypothetical protein Rsub_06545 [Raphidocelis subcapitata]|uniref:Uncharacterized protein n=1 Tax=Raphidocelis subcapitata TaxID=307507 RepID=A0A2V0PB01_9CHLO|nr:hypothetical protein Rsub_06545 [Raphidocelis subcapitata]|eukprot:GBF94275.1 hypothetical protein Rsub_06545 [Raphidocelis subcapitata]